MENIKEAQYQEFIEASHRAGREHLMLCSSGNMSWRIGDKVMISGTGSWLPAIQKEKIAILNLADATSLNGIKPSMENGFHLGVLRNRPDVNVVLHFQSEYATTIACMKNKPANFDVISGDDGITFPLITLGAVGVISVIGNALPKEFSRMVRLALNGDYQNALIIHHKFTELFKLLFVDGNPAGVKAMLNAMGLIENELRLPLVPSRISTMEKISSIIKELNIKW